MEDRTRATRLSITLLALMALLACTAQDADTDTETDTSSVINLDAFDSAGLVQNPEVVDCTLTDGTEAECAQIIVKYLPDNFQTGPYCPATLSDVGGVWDWDGDNPGLYRLNGDFFTMLNEQGYTFYDEEGNINIADPGAGGGNGTDGNNCLEASEDDTVEETALIPLSPVMADSPTDLGTVAQVGVALSSIPIFADAPSVLDTGNLPALDVCGGHIDPGGWYHWHATATDIETSFEQEGVEADCHLEQSASELFGYAFDGYPIYGSADADGSIPADLDDCSGHEAVTTEYPDGVYHYHASLTFPNLPTCLVGTSAENAFSTTASGGIGAPGGGPGGGGPGSGGPGN